MTRHGWCLPARDSAALAGPPVPTLADKGEVTETAASAAGQASW